MPMSILPMIADMSVAEDEMASSTPCIWSLWAIRLDITSSIWPSADIRFTECLLSLKIA